MLQQEQRIDAPTLTDLKAWLKQLQEDRTEHERIVNRAMGEWDRAKRNAELIQRSITACEKMIAALKDAGIA